VGVTPRCDAEAVAVIPVKTGIQGSGHPLPACARTGFVGVTIRCDGEAGAVIPVKTGIQNAGHPLPACARTGFVGVTLRLAPSFPWDLRSARQTRYPFDLVRRAQYD